MRRDKMTVIVALSLIALAFMLVLMTGCVKQDIGATVDIQPQAEDTPLDKPYSEELENKIAIAASGPVKDTRPEYLPEEMFVRLPPFPDDFYRMRTMIRSGGITDLSTLGPEYWQQPEFFPNFEEIGLPVLQKPPEGRWGAYGIAVYPADSVSTIVAGDSLDMFFFMKSSYLVETYQGINLEVVYPSSASISTSVELPDRSKSVVQDPEILKKYVTVSVEPNPFILEPNFPVYNINGTRKIRVTIDVSENMPPGNYVVGLDTGDIPAQVESEWIREYLNLYTSGGMTKIDRPYYQAFITVVRQ